MRISTVIHDALIAGVEKLSIQATITLGQFISQLVVTDNSTTLDELAKVFFKSLSDDSAAVDEAVIAFGKVISDSSGVNEQTVLYFAKSLSDSSSTSDDTTLSVGKELADSTETAEALTFALDKYLYDTVYGTDDLDGESTVEDDQEIHFHKVRSEAAFVSEVFERVVHYQRSYSDTSGATDVIANKVFKVLSDVVTATELLGSELIINESAVDSSGVSETLTAVLAKVLREEPVASETVAVEIVKPLADTTTGSEVIALSFSTARADSSTIGDNTLKLPIKSLSDSGNASDAGSYRGQGYSDFDYFLEDYVGYSGVF